MSEPNNQSNELSLDQLDGINGGTIEKVRFSAGGRNHLHRGGRIQAGRRRHDHQKQEKHEKDSMNSGKHP